MKNAYDVLGISPGATSKQIDSAYRELSKKYENKPKKLEEINLAYDSIVMNSSASYKQPFFDYSDIKEKIDGNRIEDAEILLDGIPESNRDAEWYYLKGVVQQKRGWLEESAQNFAKASRMDPANKTFRTAYRRVKHNRAGEFRSERGRSSSLPGCASCGACEICCGLICLDSCCECLSCR